MVLYTNNITPKRIHINEEQLQKLNEDVFVSGLKRKKAKLSYNKRQNTNRTRNMGNYSSSDMLDTGKMDQNNADTFIVPLKGGINSYNITSIKGTEVMHYFKNKFSKKTTNINIEVNGEKSEYELMMEDSEFREFRDTFVSKVSNVVNYVSKEIASKDKNFKGFKGVSIYPVPSSSNFNVEMAKILQDFNIGISGLPCRKIDTSLFKKDLSDLQKDTDFINKNKEYFNGRYYQQGGDDKTHIDVMNDNIRKFKNVTAAQEQSLIDNYNKCINKVILSYRNKVSPKRLALNYSNLVDAKEAIRQKLGKARWKNAFSQIKYAKGPSVESRTQEIWNIVTPILGKSFMSQEKNRVDIVEIRPENFQIKNFTNDVRMGLKNFYKAQEGIEDELARIEGTVFVIFDDNVSGGATLSDICYQASKLGIKYIVPITFGQMRTKYSVGTMKINAPEKWNF